MRALVMIVLCSVGSLACAEQRIALDADLRIDARAADAVEAAEAFGAALAGGDLDAAKEMLAEDVLVLESGGVEASRDEYFAHHAAADAKFLAGSTQTIKRRVARAQGALVWIASESELRTAAGKTIASTETLVLAKRRDGWKIVHIHWSSR
jgi:ketosteroid isomerase-like protein